MLLGRRGSGRKSRGGRSNINSIVVVVVIVIVIVDAAIDAVATTQ